MDYTDIAQPWAASPSQQKVLPARPNNKFFYRHHVKNWELIGFEHTEKAEGKRAKKTTKWLWLPNLHTFYEAAGVNACRSTEGRGVDSSLARTRMGDQGWALILPKDYDYLRCYPCRGGNYWADRFTKLENLGGQLVQTFNHDEYNEFRRQLMLDGALDLPHKSFLRLLQIQVQRRIDRHTRSQHIPEIAVKLKSLQEHAKNMSDSMLDLEKNKRAHYEL